MQYKFFVIPAAGQDVSVQEEEMNRFLRGHRVLSVKHELINHENGCCWCFCVSYLEESGGNAEASAWQKKDRPDYREILPDEEFVRFDRLRQVRKAIAQESQLPPYSILLDRQLAELAKLEHVDESALKALPGFGEMKLAKYGRRFLTRLMEMNHETDGESVQENQ